MELKELTTLELVNTVPLDKPSKEKLLAEMTARLVSSEDEPELQSLWKHFREVSSMKDIHDDFALTKKFLPPHVADHYFEHLLQHVNWHKTLMSKENQPVEINRKMAYVYQQPVMYKYANLQLPGDTWSDNHMQELKDLRDYVEEKTGYRFNSVLLNLYETGKDEIKWHSDKEVQLGEKPTIACLNLGATRTLHFAKKGEKDMKIPMVMENGDLLIMGENCQDNWLHAILPERKVKEPRISLTFRWVYE